MAILKADKIISADIVHTDSGLLGGKPPEYYATKNEMNSVIDGLASVWNNLGKLDITTETNRIEIAIPEDISEVRILSNGIESTGDLKIWLYFNGDETSTNYLHRRLSTEYPYQGNFDSLNIASSTFNCPIVMDLSITGLGLGQSPMCVADVMDANYGCITTLYHRKKEKIETLILKSSMNGFTGTLQVWGR